jgi:hypothetical protein
MSVTARATRTSVSRLRGPTIAVLRGYGCPHRYGRPFNWREGKPELTTAGRCLMANHDWR